MDGVEIAMDKPSAGAQQRAAFAAARRRQAGADRIRRAQRRHRRTARRRNRAARNCSTRRSIRCMRKSRAISSSSIAASRAASRRGLWIDMIAHVAMGRDRRTYRFVQDTQNGPVMLDGVGIGRRHRAGGDQVCRAPHGRARACAWRRMIARRGGTADGTGRPGRARHVPVRRSRSG